jgi:hypothetical protein
MELILNPAKITILSVIINNNIFSQYDWEYVGVSRIRIFIILRTQLLKEYPLVLVLANHKK